MLINDPEHWRLRIPRAISEAGTPRWLANLVFRLITPKENRDKLNKICEDAVKSSMFAEKTAKRLFADHPVLAVWGTPGKLALLPGGVVLIGNAFNNCISVFGEDKLVQLYAKYVLTDEIFVDVTTYMFHLFRYFEKCGYFNYENGTMSAELDDPEVQIAVNQMLLKELAEIISTAAPGVWQYETLYKELHELM